MVVLEFITKKLAILMAADPQTVSSKSATARKYGTRIAAEYLEIIRVSWVIVKFDVESLSENLWYSTTFT